MTLTCAHLRGARDHLEVAPRDAVELELLQLRVAQELVELRVELEEHALVLRVEQTLQERGRRRRVRQGRKATSEQAASRTQVCVLQLCQTTCCKYACGWREPERTREEERGERERTLQRNSS